MKRFLALLALIVLLASTVVSVTANETPTLNVWIKKTFSTDLNEAWKNAAIEYGKKNGWNVEVTIIATADQVQIFTAALEGNSMPDVFYVSETLIPMIEVKGVFMDLSDVAAKRIEEGGFVSPRAWKWQPSATGWCRFPSIKKPRAFYRKSMRRHRLCDRQDLMKLSKWP